MAKITGCLESLRKDGLVREPKHRMFQQVSPPTKYVAPKKPTLHIAKSELEEDSKIMPTPKKGTHVEPRSPIEVISELEEKMNEMQETFEAAALELTEYFEQYQEQLKDLAMFRELMGKMNK